MAHFTCSLSAQHNSRSHQLLQLLLADIYTTTGALCSSFSHLSSAGQLPPSVPVIGVGFWLRFVGRACVVFRRSKEDGGLDTGSTAWVGLGSWAARRDRADSWRGVATRNLRCRPEGGRRKAEGGACLRIRCETRRRGSGRLLSSSGHRSTRTRSVPA